MKQHIYLIAPGYGCTSAQLQRVIQILKQEFPAYIIHHHPDLLASDAEKEQQDLAHSANSAVKRAQVIIDSLNSITVEYSLKDQYILWCLTGGEGSPETIEELNKHKHAIQLRNQTANKNIWIIGFSDSSSMLNYLVETYNIRGLYGPDLLNFCDIISPGYKSDATLTEEKSAIKKILIKQERVVKYDQLCSLNAPAKAISEIVGTTIGGLLTSLYGCIGTFWELQTENKILFIEGVIEPFELISLEHVLYHPRFLQLILKSRAVVFGDVSPFSLKKPLTAEEYTDVVQRLQNFALFVEQYQIPVFFGLPCGHTGTRSVGYSGKSLPVIFNGPTEIKSDGEKVSISFFPYADIACYDNENGKVRAESPLILKKDKIIWHLPKPIYLQKANSFDPNLLENKCFPLIGGNLRILHERIITPNSVDPRNKILFIEYNEREKVQASAVVNINVFLRRTLMHFYQAGLLADIKALIVGKIDSFYNPSVYLNHLIYADWKKNENNSNVLTANKEAITDLTSIQPLIDNNYITVDSRENTFIIHILNQDEFSQFYHQTIQRFFYRMIKRFCREREITTPTLVAEYYTFDIPDWFSANVTFTRHNNLLVMQEDSHVRNT